MPEVINEFQLRRFSDADPIQLYRPVASPASPSGYFGRTTIMEFLVMNDPLRRLVMQHADMGVIEQAARDNGMRTMYEDGLVKAMQGVTTIEEVLRVTQEG
jgi:general secretion pathway protein E